MTGRLVVAAACLALGSVAIGATSRPERVPARAAFSGFPGKVGEWQQVREDPLDPKIRAIVGVDDYLNRVYQAGPRAVGLYVGYYASQRSGDTIHSPLNCLPGAGWEPVKTDRSALTVENGQTIRVNQFVIQKGIDRQVVVYWYQSHGRVVASEYLGKVYMVLDALRLNRTDGALVRIVAPIDDRAADGEADAVASARQFATKIFGLLGGYLPA